MGKKLEEFDRSGFAEFFEKFVQQSYHLPGFYSLDAHAYYFKWAVQQGCAPYKILGAQRFAYQLEVKGLERTSRRGLVFFTHAQIKGMQGRKVAWKP